MREECFVPRKVGDRNKTVCSVWEINHFSKNENLSDTFNCYNINA